MVWTDPQRGNDMTIKDAAAQSGLSVDTIRFYEKAGMLPRIRRDGRGWRLFDKDVLDWLCDLERLRATGMPMAEMRQFATLVHATDAERPGAAAQRLAILERHAARLVARQADLDACRAYLARKITIYQRMTGQQT